MIGDERLVFHSFHHNECIDVCENESIDWREKCIQLEFSLQRIRQIFIEKINRLEHQLLLAEERAEEAEEKYSALMESLNSGSKLDKFNLREGNGDEDYDDNKEGLAPELYELKHAMEQKEKVINELELKIEEQKSLRLRDAKQVEVKAAKIKDWVSMKLKELEEQNLHLREQNRKCNEELNTLRKHLHKASPETRRKIEFVLTNYYQTSAQNDESEAISYENVSNKTLNNEVPDIVSARSLRYKKPDYDLLSFTSSSDDESLNLSAYSVQSIQRKPIPPPRTRIPVAIGNNARPAPQLNIPAKSANTINTSLFNRAGSLDRKLADMRKLNFNELRKKKIGIATDEIHDYSDIYTPTHEVNLFIPAQREGRPPTPPMHRCPSWESRIYQIASTGIKSATTTPTHSFRKNHNPFEKNENELQMIGGLNVPVFATVQGRASRIRSIPFTGDSTDSSDNETDGRIKTMGTTSSSSGHESDLFATPVKAFKRGASVESQLSSDYCLPPDAVMSASFEGLGITEATQEPKTPKRFSSLQRPITGSPTRNNEVLEKSGYLTKLGGRLKTWKRWWFVLKDGVLCYYKSQNEVTRSKPRGQIILDKKCRISSTSGSGTFQIITGNKKKVYYLSADSLITLEEWVRILQIVLKRNATFYLRDDQKPTIEGWLVKVKHGHSKRCWCVLVGRTFAYFKSPNDSTPIGQIDLKGARVEEVDNMSDSDNEGSVTASNTGTNVTQTDFSYTIAIFPKQEKVDPIYLLMTSRQDLDSWLYHLTVVSAGEHSAGTAFEHLIAKLMYAETESPKTIDSHVIWKDPLLLYSKESITQSLTTLPNEYLRGEAVKLFKSLQLFISVPLDSAGIDYHISLVQNSLQLCLTCSELQSEIYCQLIKQTSPHTQHKLCASSGVQNFILCATQSIFTCDSSGSGSEKTSPTSVNSNTIPASNALSPCDRLNPSNYVFIQAFQFLSLAISLFVPQSRTLWYLRQHLRRSVDTKTDIGKYAIYCQRALERSIQNGPREYRPSRMEVLSILLRNPYHHSLPHSIPVNLVNGTYVVVGFDGSSTVEEFITLLNNEVGIRDSNQSGFALYSDDPLDKSIEHLLEAKSKLADIISRWEILLREKHLGKFENTRVVKLIYKHRLCLKHYIKSETDKERLLMTYEINNEIMKGRFPVTQDLALELCALIAQIEFADFVNINRPNVVLQQVADRFYPLHLKEGVSTKTLLDSIRDKWMELRGRSSIECVRIYLNCSRKWPLCGSKLFEAKLTKPLKVSDSMSSFGLISSHTKIWIAVSDDSIVLLDFNTLQVIIKYPYKSLMTFGGFKDEFMLVVASKSGTIEVDSGSGSGSGSSRSNSVRSERLLFVMSKSKIMEITLLIADYINAESRLNDTEHNNTIDKYSTSGGFLSRGASLRIIASDSHTKL